MLWRIHGKCVGVANRDVIESLGAGVSRVARSLIRPSHDTVVCPANAAHVYSGASTESATESGAGQMQGHLLRFRAISHDHQILGHVGDSWMLPGRISDRKVAPMHRERTLRWPTVGVSDAMSARESASGRALGASWRSSPRPPTVDHTIWPRAVGSLATRCSPATGTRFQRFTRERGPQVLRAQRMCPDRVASPPKRHQRNIETACPDCVGPLGTDVDSRDRRAEHIVSGAVSGS